MGDRANICFIQDTNNKDGAKGVYLYSHSEGTDLYKLAAKALNSPDARSRWSDIVYLTRIVIQDILRDKEGPLGWGISASLTDNEHPILVIDADAQRVALRDMGTELLYGRIGPHEGLSFEKFASS